MTPRYTTGVANHWAPVVTPLHAPGRYLHRSLNAPTFAAVRPVSGVRLVCASSPRRWVQSAVQPVATSTAAARRASPRPGRNRRVVGVGIVATLTHPERCSLIAAG